MPTTFRPYDPGQMLLMPPTLRDWLPEGHLAHHVSDLVDGLELDMFYAPCEAADPWRPTAFHGTKSATSGSITAQ